MACRKKHGLGSSEGLVAQEEAELGRFVWNLCRVAQKGKPGGREAGRRPLLSGFSFPFPGNSVLIFRHSSLLQSHFDSAPTPSPPSWRGKEDAGYSFLIQAIDGNVRPRN